jgi:autotransporter-associated beta strand protein
MISLRRTTVAALVCAAAMASSCYAQNGSLPQPEKNPAPALPAPAPAAGVTAIVDDYLNELHANPADPTVPVLSEFEQYYKPGTAWNNGTIVNPGVLAYNNQYVVKLTTNCTQDQAVAAYLDDRRNQSYSIIDGLGPLTSLYLAGAQSVTTIPAWDLSTLTTEYDDAGTGNAGGSLASPLADVVALVNNIRSFSTTPDKNFYNYPRPWRLDTSGVVEDTGTTQSEVVTDVNGASTTVGTRTWNVYNSSVVVDPYLLVVRSQTAASDQGFPSGHTNAGYSAVLAMAYTLPQRYQELLTRASELGTNRILAGMHSPLDVMGGRMSATAWAAAILYNDNMFNTSSPLITKAEAYANTQSYFYQQTGADVNSLYAYAHSAGLAQDRFADWATNKANFTDRLTYGFKQIGSTAEPMLVPKGAEVLLETRQPYLDPSQRRWELYTTGLQSGYPLLDDAEGWGRLNLFAAADGYGALDGNVFVNMNASLGGYNADDAWKNDISGSGKLFKQGDGRLKLTGDNSYSGGTEIDGGVLEADSYDALGRGDVVVAAGTLVANATSAVTIRGGYNQLPGATLEADLGSGNAGHLTVDGEAGFGGVLNIVFPSSYKAKSGTVVEVVTALHHTGKFASVNVAGTTAKYSIVYSDCGVQVKFQ